MSYKIRRLFVTSLPLGVRMARSSPLLDLEQLVYVFIYLTRCFVYVIGLHAVQFGNTELDEKAKKNWTRPWAQFNLAVRGIFLNLIISKLDKHLVLLHINYITCSQSIQRNQIHLCPGREKPLVIVGITKQMQVTKSIVFTNKT